jgi:hypothetical protein
VVRKLREYMSPEISWFQANFAVAALQELQSIRFQIFQRHKLKRARMRRLQINRRGAIVFERRFPARNAHAPFVARFQSRKSPFRNRCDQIVPVQHGEIEKFARDFNANRMQTDIFRPGATKSVAIKTGHRIAATTF